MKKCTECRAPVKESAAESYHYTASGLPNVFLSGISVYKCTECGAEFVQIPHPTKLHAALAKAVAEKPVPLTSDEIRFLRKWLGRSNNDFARLMGVKPEHTSRWVSGALPMPPTAERLLRSVVILQLGSGFSLDDLAEIDEKSNEIPGYALMRDDGGWVPQEVAKA